MPVGVPQVTFSNLLLLVIINIFILYLIGKTHFSKADEFSIIIINNNDVDPNNPVNQRVQ